MGTIETYLLSRPWLPTLLWVALYTSDYYLTIWGSRLYRRQKFIEMEGSYELTAEFQDDIFFADVVDGEVFVVDANNRSDVKYLYTTRAVPVDFSQGPDGYVYSVNLSANTITRLLIEPIQV